MTATTSARLLEDLIGDLVSAVTGLAGHDGDPARMSGVRPVSVEFDLPVETRVSAGAEALIVRADVPPTRTRTTFDRPLGRLSVRLVGRIAS